VAAYVIRRVLYSIPVLIASTFLSFTFISLAGDPRANLRANPTFSVQTYNMLEHTYHLDRAIPVRYWYWVEDAFTHKLGSSLRTSQLPEIRVISRHIVRNALIPILTVATITIAGQLGGAIVTETVFSLDGMGYYFVQRLGALDLYPVMGYLVVTSVIIIVANLLADVLYGYLDPRIRLS
jgi:ABC-type dipeptide/oligopeptide/nickel transport system permease component